MRAVALIAGAGLLVGFFLPWLRFADVAKFSGLSLMVSGGSAVEALTGPARGMLIIIPVCGAVLVASAVFAPRLAGLASLVSGLAILGFGLFTLARMFIATVGLGMWLVVVSSLVAAGVGAVAVAGGRSASE